MANDEWDVQRTLGEHGARLDNVECALQEMRADIKTILGHVERARGGWKTFLFLTGSGGGVGAAIASAVYWLKGG
jgi:hypothetical protein